MSPRDPRAAVAAVVQDYHADADIDKGARLGGAVEAKGAHQHEAGHQRATGRTGGVQGVQQADVRAGPIR